MQLKIGAGGILALVDRQDASVKTSRRRGRTAGADEITRHTTTLKDAVPTPISAHFEELETRRTGDLASLPFSF